MEGTVDALRHGHSDLRALDSCIPAWLSDLNAQYERPKAGHPAPRPADAGDLGAPPYIRTFLRRRIDQSRRRTRLRQRVGRGSSRSRSRSSREREATNVSKRTVPARCPGRARPGLQTCGAAITQRMLLCASASVTLRFAERRLVKVLASIGLQGPTRDRDWIVGSRGLRHVVPPISS